jgi:hypothetical protein
MVVVAQAIAALKSSNQQFLRGLHQAINSCEFRAVFFETPGVIQATVAPVPFEFTLVEMTPPEAEHSVDRD